MPRQVSYEEWEAELRERDPNWDRTIAAIRSSRGPRRKIPLLVDGNLLALVDGFKDIKDFRSPLLPQEPPIESCGTWRG